MTYTLSSLRTATTDRLGDSVDDRKLNQWANDTNREICNSRRWRFMEEVFIGTVTAGYTAYDLPEDFQAAINFTLTDPDNNASFINFIPYEEFDQLYPDPTALTAAMPTLWTFYGNSLIIGPGEPDQGYTMQLRYIKQPGELSDDSDVPDVPEAFQEAMILGMLKRALMAADNYDFAQVIGQEFERQMDFMTERLQARQYGELYRMNTGRYTRNNSYWPR